MFPSAKVQPNAFSFLSIQQLFSLLDQEHVPATPGHPFGYLQLGDYREHRPFTLDLSFLELLLKVRLSVGASHHMDAAQESRSWSVCLLLSVCQLLFADKHISYIIGLP